MRWSSKRQQRAWNQLRTEQLLKKFIKKIIVIEKTTSQHLSFPGGVWVRGEMSVGKPWSKASLRCF